MEENRKTKSSPAAGIGGWGKSAAAGSRSHRANHDGYRRATPNKRAFRSAWKPFQIAPALALALALVLSPSFSRHTSLFRSHYLTLALTLSLSLSLCATHCATAPLRHCATAPLRHCAFHSLSLSLDGLCCLATKVRLSKSELAGFVSQLGHSSREPNPPRCFSLSSGGS